jgi:hypothetical protein
MDQVGVKNPTQAGVASVVLELALFLGEIALAEYAAPRAGDSTGFRRVR